MTALLASVTGPEEAIVALNAGADIIDLKDPTVGALGALPVETIRSTVRAVAARRRTSATVGDLPAEPETLSAAVALTANTGVDFVKVGFFGEAGALPCIRALRLQADADVKLVAVLFADLAPNLRLLPMLSRAGFWGVMLDTADKHRGGLRKLLPHKHLDAFVRQARRSRLFTGLAGSLTRADIPALLPLNPDYLGFRTALCRQGRRTDRVDRDAITAVRRLIQTPCDATRHTNTPENFTNQRSAKRSKPLSRAQR